MIRDLLAVENGQPSSLFEEARCARWASLDLCRSRSIRPQSGSGIFYNGEDISCIDLDTVSGCVLLTAGTLRGNASEPRIGFVGAHSVPPERTFESSYEYQSSAPASANVRSPLAASMGVESDGPIISIQWLPHDLSMFVTGSRGGAVVAWDAEAFEPCLRSNFLGDVDGRVETLALRRLDISRAPGAPQGLVAVACESTDVRLLDLNSNSSSQCLSGNRSFVTDVVWSPTNPFLLAAAGQDSSIRLYDIRRSGRTACVHVLDMARTVSSIYPGDEASISPGTAEGRAPKRRRHLLGAGTPFEHREDTSGMVKRHRSNPRTRRRLAPTAHDGSVQRVRFSPDGRVLVSSGRDLRVRVWDSVTGHCQISSFPGMCDYGREVFEVSGDGSIVVSCADRGIKLHDIANGNLLSSLGGTYGRPLAMTVHPFREEVFTATTDGEILCWAPHGKPLSGAAGQ